MKKIIAITFLIAILLSLTACSETNKKGNSYIEDILNVPAITLKSRMIYFETNGGNKINAIDLNEYEGDMPIPTKANHDFLGWYLDPSFNSPVTYPFRPEGDVTVYAKWIKTKGYTNGNDCAIKCAKQTYFISPNGFDLNDLQANGYKLKLTIEYDIFYEKDYDVLWDIGYAGAPEYETYIYIDEYTIYSKEGIYTPSKKEHKSLTKEMSVSTFNGSNLKLEFSTNNVQNIIYIKNIKGTYEFYK